MKRIIYLAITNSSWHLSESRKNVSRLTADQAAIAYSGAWDVLTLSVGA